MNVRAPKGTDDILPPVSATWRRLLRAWSTWTERYGYDLIVTPLFEAVEVFSRGVGEFNELVEKQMYTFRDKGGRMLALRPEGTASVVRSYLQAGAAGIWKVAYEGPMFRYERPQAGRRRQFYQLAARRRGSHRAGLSLPERCSGAGARGDDQFDRRSCLPSGISASAPVVSSRTRIAAL